MLFIAGSGNANRHGIVEDIDTGTHEIVDGLTEAGYVGLRYDKRGIGETAASPDPLDRAFDDDVADAAAALAYLRGCPTVISTRSAVIGHSEGGLISLLLAVEAATPPPALVLLACPGRTVDQVIDDQITWAGKQAGLSDDVVAAQVERFHRFVNYVRSPDQWTETSMPADVYIGLRQRRWMAEILRWDPAELIRRVQCPILLIQGGRDQQISVEKDAMRLVEASREAHGRVELCLYDDLDHLLKYSTAKPQLREYTRQRPVDHRVITDIARWLDKTV